MSTPPAPHPSEPSPGLAIVGRSSALLRWAPLLVILLAWVAHGSVRHAGWVLDDVRLVRDNTEVARGPAAIPHMFSRRAASQDLESGSYGPLVRASFALEAPLWTGRSGALSPRGFHLTNLLLHGLCALLFLQVLLTLMPGRGILALGAAVCFAVHPLHTGTVSALMGRAELLATLFSLLATLAWRRAGPGRASWLFLAVFSWWLALLSKDVAIGLPLAWVLLARILPPPAAARPPRWGWALLALPLLLFGLSWSGVPTPGFDLPAQGLGERLLVGLEGLGRLALLLLLPVGLRADYSDESLPDLGYQVAGLGWLAVAVALAFSLLACWRLRSRRAGVPSSSWTTTLCLALPALCLLPAGASLDPRFAYFCALPLFAVAGRLAEALVTGASRVAGTTGRSSFAAARAALVGGLVVVCLVAMTHREAHGWKDNEALHEHLLERNPRHVRAMIRIARSHRLTANERRQAASLLPAQSPERRRLIDERVLSLDSGLAWARRAVSHEYGGRNAEALRELGFLLLAKDDSAGALRALEQAQEADPVLQRPVEEVVQVYPPERLRAAAELYLALGRAREALGSPELAADAFLMASRLDDERNDYRIRAGLALCRVKRYGEGLSLLHEALARTRNRQQRNELEESISNAQESARRIAAETLRKGEAEQEKGRMRDAATLYESAVEIDPTSIEGWIRAGWIRGEHFGNYVRAEAYFKRAEDLLTETGVPRSEKVWARIEGYRRLLREQKAEEDAEETRLLEEQRRRFEAEKKARGG
jgi:tetratricopeptide (TPR) repeat protein